MTQVGPGSDRDRSAWIRRFEELAETHYGPLVIVSLGLGVIFRLLLIWTTTTSSYPYNHLYPGYTDGEEYLDNAQSLVETGVFGYAGRPSAFRPPAYPFVMACSMRLLGGSLTPIRILQVGMFVAMALIYCGVTARYFGRAAGVLAVNLLSLYPLFAFMTTEIATESLYMLLEGAVFFLTLALLEPEVRPARRTWMAFLAGLICGAGTLTRPNMFVVFLLLLTAVVVVGLWRRTGWSSWLLPAVGLAIGTYGVLIPWMSRNEHRFGAPVITTNLYYNLFRGTFDLVEGIPPGTTIQAIFREHNVLYEGQIEDADLKRLPMGEIESERNAREAALSIIRADPVGWLWQRLRNAAYLWLNLQWDFDILHTGPLVSFAAISVTVIYYVLLAGALLGSLFLWRSPRDSGQRIFVTVAWFGIAAATPTVLTFVGKRYRVSMIDPYLVLLVCAALASWLRRRRPESSH